ncbi:MAG: hypothetical protein EOO26_06710 [Comamonadaceae bacterium]|nr:MAG: hypothetical protein EOO26_06710 [Comamonadaceae bacterium]
MLQFLRTRLSFARKAPDPHAAYQPLVDALPPAAVPLAHALVHAVDGINDDLRRWLDLRLAARAPTALGQPASRAVVAVWHALQDGQATGLQVSADEDWTLLHAIGRDNAALEAMRFVLRVHVVTVEQWLPGAVDAARALAASMVSWPDADPAPATATSRVTPPR